MTTPSVYPIVLHVDPMLTWSSLSNIVSTHPSTATSCCDAMRHAVNPKHINAKIFYSASRLSICHPTTTKIIASAYCSGTT